MAFTKILLAVLCASIVAVLSFGRTFEFSSAADSDALEDPALADETSPVSVPTGESAYMTREEFLERESMWLERLREAEERSQPVVNDIYDRLERHKAWLEHQAGVIDQVRDATAEGFRELSALETLQLQHEATRP